MKMKEESEKVGLKLNIQKIKIMASGPIASWQIYWETMETVTDYFLKLQNHCHGDCSHEIERCLLTGRKAMTYMAYKKQTRFLANKGLYGRSYGFSSSHVWM